VLFPPDEVKVFADAKKAADNGIIAAVVKAAVDAGNAAVAQAKAEAEVKAKEAAVIKAKTDAEVKAKEAAANKVKAEAEIKAKEAAAKAKAEAEVKAKEAAANKAKAEAEVKAKEAAAKKAKAKAEFKAAVLNAQSEERPLITRAAELQIAATAAAKQKDSIIAKLSKSCFECKSFDEAHDTSISYMRKELREVEEKTEAARLELSSAPSRRAAAKEKFEAATHMLHKTEEPLRQARAVHDEVELAATKVNEAVRFRRQLGVAALCIGLFVCMIASIFVYVYRVAPSEFFSPYVSAPLILLCTCAFWGLLSANSSEFNERISATSNAVREAEVLIKQREKEHALENEQYFAHLREFEAVEASCSATQKVMDACIVNHQRLNAKIAETEELERKYNEGMVEKERLFNESIVRKRQQAVLDAEAADAQAAAAYQIALNAFIARIPVAQFGDEASEGKDEAIRQEFHRLMATRIQEEEEILARRIEEERKKKIEANKPGFFGHLFNFLGIIAGAVKHTPTEKEERGDNVGGCGGMDTSNKPMPHFRT
jgi:hypothetical protein